MTEIYKYLHELSPELMTDIFILQQNPYNIRQVRLFGSRNPWSVSEATVLCASQSWQKIPTEIKKFLNISSLEIFIMELWDLWN